MYLSDCRDVSLLSCLLMDEWSTAFQNVLDVFIKADREAIFHYPVDVGNVDDYLQVVEQPMDFSTIQKNLQSSYYSMDDLHEFQRHLELTFNNAILFNRPRSVYAMEARRMRSMLLMVFRKFLTTGQRIKLARQACQQLQRTKPRVPPDSGGLRTAAGRAAWHKAECATTLIQNGAAAKPWSRHGSKTELNTTSAHLDKEVAFALNHYTTQVHPFPSDLQATSDPDGDSVEDGEPHPQHSRKSSLESLDEGCSKESTGALSTFSAAGSSSATAEPAGCCYTDEQMKDFQSHLHLLVDWVLLTHERQRRECSPIALPLPIESARLKSFYDVRQRLSEGWYLPKERAPPGLLGSLQRLKKDTLAALGALGSTKGMKTDERREHAALVRMCSKLVEQVEWLIVEHWELPVDVAHGHKVSDSCPEDGIDSDAEHLLHPSASAASGMQVNSPASGVDDLMPAEAPEQKKPKEWAHESGSSLGHARRRPAKPLVCPQPAMFTFAERVEHILEKQPLLDKTSHILGEVYIGKNIKRDSALYDELLRDQQCQRRRAQLVLLEEQIHKLEGKYLSDLAGDPRYVSLQHDETTRVGVEDRKGPFVCSRKSCSEAQTKPKQNE